jgi:hypothetical protein
MIRVHSRTIGNVSVDHGCLGGIAWLPYKNDWGCAPTWRHFSLILGPDVKKYSICLKCSCLLQNVGIGEVWRLRYMQLGIEKSVYVLYLSIDAPALMLDTAWTFLNSQYWIRTPKFSFTPGCYFYLTNLLTSLVHLMHTCFTSGGIYIWISCPGTCVRAKHPHIRLHLSDLFLDFLQDNLYAMPHHFSEVHESVPGCGSGDVC